MMAFVEWQDSKCQQETQWTFVVAQQPRLEYYPRQSRQADLKAAANLWPRLVEARMG